MVLGGTPWCLGRRRRRGGGWERGYTSDTGSAIDIDALAARIQGELGLGQAGALVIDREGAIEVLVQVDRSPGITAPWTARRHINALATEFDGVVIRDRPSVLEAKELIETAAIGRRQPRRGGVGRRDRETAIVPGD